MSSAIVFAIGFGCLLSGFAIAICFARRLPGPSPFYGDQITTDPDAGREGRLHG
jgi:hypothetical protein